MLVVTGSSTVVLLSSFHFKWSEVLLRSLVLSGQNYCDMVQQARFTYQLCWGMEVGVIWHNRRDLPTSCAEGWRSGWYGTTGEIYLPAVQRDGGRGNMAQQARFTYQLCRGMEVGVIWYNRRDLPTSCGEGWRSGWYGGRGDMARFTYQLCRGMKVGVIWYNRRDLPTSCAEGWRSGWYGTTGEIYLPAVQRDGGRGNMAQQARFTYKLCRGMEVGVIWRSGWYGEIYLPTVQRDEGRGDMVQQARFTYQLCRGMEVGVIWYNRQDLPTSCAEGWRSGWMYSESAGPVLPPTSLKSTQKWWCLFNFI